MVDAGVQLEDSDATLPFDGSFCRRYDTLMEGDPNQRDTDGFARYLQDLAELRTAAPPDVQPGVDALTAYVEELQERSAPFDHDAEAYLASLDADGWDEHEELYQAVYEVFAESAFARYAHRSCGARDPAFVLACPSDFTDDWPGDLLALAEHIDRELAELPSGTTSREQVADPPPGPEEEFDSVDVAYLDADGRTIRVTRYSAVDANRYQLVSSQVCPTS